MIFLYHSYFSCYIPPIFLWIGRSPVAMVIIEEATASSIKNPIWICFVCLFFLRHLCTGPLVSRVDSFHRTALLLVDGSMLTFLHLLKRRLKPWWQLSFLLAAFSMYSIESKADWDLLLPWCQFLVWHFFLLFLFLHIRNNFPLNLCPLHPLEQMWDCVMQVAPTLNVSFHSRIQ